MWHGGSIELTRERLAVVARLETAPASGGTVVSARFPASAGAMPSNKRRGKLGRVLEERLQALSCGGSQRRGVLAGAAAMAGRQCSVARGGAQAAFL
jgi:hypothetical protein